MLQDFFHQGSCMKYILTINLSSLQLYVNQPYLIKYILNLKIHHPFEKQNFMHTHNPCTAKSTIAPVDDQHEVTHCSLI